MGIIGAMWTYLVLSRTSSRMLMLILAMPGPLEGRLQARWEEYRYVRAS
jgi:hypothetical protein